LRSNRWPGAYAFGKDDRFANIYIGYGTKYTGEPYSPPLPPTPAKESEQPVEANDPSAEEEAEFEKQQKEAEQPVESATDPSEEDEDISEEEEDD
jgi:radial spoke head protein 4A